MNKSVLSRASFAALALMALALAQSALMADILFNLPIEHAETDKLRLFFSTDSFLNTTLRRNLTLAFAAFAATFLLIAWLERTATITKPHQLIILSGSALTAVIATFIFPLTSLDIFLYISYGRQLVELGHSPYQTALGKLLSDHVISQYPIGMWGEITALYGPLAIVIFSILAFLSKQEPVVLLVIFKLFSLFVFLACFLLAKKICKDNSVVLPVTSLFGFFGNPTVMIMLLIEGHIDAVAIIFLLAGMAALHHQRKFLLGLAVGSACCIKITFFSIIPLFGISMLRRVQKNDWLAVLAFGLTIVLFYSIFNGAELKAAYHYATDPQRSFFGPIPKAIKQVLRVMANLLDAGDMYSIEGLTRKTSTLLLLLGLTGLYLSFWRKGSSESIFVWAGFALVFSAISMNWFMPWYILWGWPLLLFSRQPLSLRFGMVSSGSLLILLNTFDKDFLKSSPFLEQLASSVFLIGALLTLLAWLVFEEIPQRRDSRRDNA